MIPQIRIVIVIELLLFNLSFSHVIIDYNVEI